MNKDENTGEGVKRRHRGGRPAALNEQQVALVLDRLATGRYTYRSLAETMGCSERTIQRIWVGTYSPATPARGGQR